MSQELKVGIKKIIQIKKKSKLYFQDFEIRVTFETVDTYTVLVVTIIKTVDAYILF